MTSVVADGDGGSDGTIVTTTTGAQIRARRVVSTLPTNALGGISFDPLYLTCGSV